MGIDVNQLIKRGTDVLGTPYSWGGGGPSGKGYGFDQGSGIYGFDCSSLMQYIFAGFGVNLPRVTYDQINVGAQVGYDNLKAGDLVFFIAGSQGPEHVGLYIGNGQFLQAPKTGDVVKISSMADPYYRSNFMGGRRVAEISGGGTYDPNTPSMPVPADRDPGRATQNVVPKTPEDMAAEFGWAYAFLQGEPELKKVFQEAVKGSWTAERFQAAVQGTKWWQTNSDTMRAAKVMQKSDPATYQATLAANVAKVKQMAMDIGAVVPDKTLSQLAADVLTFGMTDQMLTQRLAGYINFQKDHTLGGQAGAVEKFARSTAYKNGVIMSDDAIKTYAQRIAGGEISMEQFGKSIRDLAKGLFPSYAAELDAGQDMQDMAQGYITTMGDVLEINPEKLDLFDPTIKKALNGRDANGDPSGMDYTAFEDLLKADPRWMKTKNAQDGMMAAGHAVLQDFGLIPKQ